MTLAALILLLQSAQTTYGAQTEVKVGIKRVTDPLWIDGPVTGLWFSRGDLYIDSDQA